MPSNIPQDKILQKVWKPKNPEMRLLAENLNLLNSRINGLELINGNVSINSIGGISLYPYASQIKLPWTPTIAGSDKILIELGAIDGSIPKIGAIGLDADPPPVLELGLNHSLVWIKADYGEGNFTIESGNSLPAYVLPDPEQEEYDEIFYFPIIVLSWANDAIIRAKAIKNWHLNTFVDCKGVRKTLPAG